MLLIKWKGPYTVLNVSGPVDYRINVDGRSLEERAGGTRGKKEGRLLASLLMS